MEKLGYNHPTDVIEDERFCIATSPVNCNYHIIIKGAFDATNPYRTWNCAGRIDCGTNELLFLAIAALRDDTDKNQWFVYPNENIWFICNDYDINYVREYIRDSVQYAWFHCSHKATVNELIEHFKIKEE